MIIVYFDYISSIVRLYLYSSTCSYSAYSCDQRVSGRHCVSVVLIHCLSADAPYISGHQVVDRRCDIPVESSVAVTESTNYTKLSKKIIHQADDLANLSPYNPIVHETTTEFKPTYIPAKIVISFAVTITNYIKVHVTNTSEFKHSYYKPSSNKSSGSI
jgi:hypothetical protein